MTALPTWIWIEPGAAVTLVWHSGKDQGVAVEDEWSCRLHPFEFGKEAA
jgi:hypothetical protein